MSKDYKTYWKKNVRFLTILLSVWFVVSFLMGIIFSEELDNIEFFGFKLGFWVAQQGSIVVYIAIIFFYVRGMNKLDKEFDVSDEPQEIAEH